MQVDIDTSEDAARSALRNWGSIDSPGTKLLGDAVRMLEGAEEALNEDPDVNAQDRAHEIADDSYNASSYIKDTPEVFDLDDEGLAGDDASPREKVSAGIYNLLRNICADAIESNRPDVMEVDWSEARPRRGYVLVGRSEDEGFIYLTAELRQRDWGIELAISGDTRDGGGQIDMHLDADDFEPAPGWSRDELRQLWAIWDRWHLNGMNAACPHQRSIAERMGKKPHEIFTTRYGAFTDGHYSKMDENGIRRITGHYGRGADGKQVSEARIHCLHCDHDYGSTWLHEELPAEVVEFIERRFPTARAAV